MNDYDKTEAARINRLPDSELGEGGPFLEFDIPSDLTYDEYPVAEMGYDGRNIWVEYDCPDAIDGWDYFSFNATMLDDGTIVLSEDVPPGVMSPKEVYETHTDAPHARSLEPLYDAMHEVGVRFEYEVNGEVEA